MSKCSNEKCKKDVDPEWDTGCLVISVDGDMVCSAACYEEYKKQVDHFYSHILPNDKAFSAWLGVS